MIGVQHAAGQTRGLDSLRRGELQQFELIGRWTEIGDAHTGGDMSGYGSYDVPPMERMRDRRPEVTRVANSVHPFEPHITMDKADESVVRGDDVLAFVATGDDPPLRADAGVNDGDVHGAGWVAGHHLAQDHGPVNDVVRLDMMGDVDEPNVRGDLKDDALHCSDVVVAGSEIGNERYQRHVSVVFHESIKLYATPHRNVNR